MRMPLLQEALVNVTKFTKPLGMKLDDAAIAFGAALLRAKPDAKAKYVVASFDSHIGDGMGQTGLGGCSGRLLI